MTRSCEHVHELSGFITGRKFLDYLKKYQFLEEESAMRSFSITHAEVFRKVKCWFTQGRIKLFGAPRQ